MAYSGLGTGTQADPYQITTVSQFKEMDSTTYSGKYFLQMNDLDFIEEVGFSMTNFSCKYDGGGHRVINIQLYTNGFITLRDSVSIKNVHFIFNRFYSANLPIFKSSNYVNYAQLSGITIACSNKSTHSAKIFNAYFETDCVISNITATGNFSEIIYVTKCNVTNIHIYNSALSHVPMIITDGASIVIDKCLYIKPFTKTVSNTPKGLFIDSPNSRMIINECAVIVNKYINDAPARLTISLGGFVGSGEMEIRNSYVVGSFEAPRGHYFHALHGRCTKNDCIFSGNYFYGNLVSDGKYDDNVVSGLPSTGCYYCKELTTGRWYKDQYATGLTIAQFKESTSFGFDFVAMWQQGLDRPLLLNVSEDLLQFYQDGIYDTGPINLGEIQRISGTQFSVQLTTDNTADFGIEISENGVVVDTKFNEKGTVIFNTTKDYDAVIKAFHFAGEIRAYVASQSYYHYHLDQIAVTDVTVDKYTYLEKSGSVGAYIHGSILIGDYLYGTSRGSTFSTDNSIVKVLASDVSQFEAFPISVLPTKGAWQMDSVCQIGNKLYTVAADNKYYNYMIVFDLLTNTHQSYFINEKQSWGAPSYTDGTYLYVCLAPDLVSKIDPAVFNSTEKYNTSSPWPLQSLDFVNTSGTIAPHTMIGDSEHLYVGLASGGDITETSQALLKINKQTMQLIAAATGVPKMTDDMTQTDTHLVVGVEPRSSSSYGAKIGCCAIRKSDMRVTTIRKLHETDQPDVKSFASLIFGNYLIDLKTNSHIYALDISNPDSWNDDDRGAHTLKVYKTLKPNGLATDPINEVYLTESGKFVGFAWAPISYAVSFDLPGLDYFAEPTVITDDAAIVGDTGASLSGYITSTGGKAVSEAGVIIGQAADLSDGISYPVAPVTTEFEKAFSDLDFGTYYFRTYAVNAEGTGYGKIKSFTLEEPYTEPEQPSGLDKAIQAEISISWTAPADDGGSPIIGYKIERKISGGEWEIIVANTGNTNTTYTKTLPQGVYQYRVSAITTYGTGPSSATLDVNAVVGGGGAGAGAYKIYLGSTEMVVL